MNKLLLNVSALSLTLLSLSASAVAAEACYDDAIAAVENEHFDKAESILNVHIGHSPDDRRARFLLARVLSWQNNWDAATEQLTRLLEEQNDNADYLLARANTYEWMGRRKDALLDLDEARMRSPGYAELWRTQITYLRREETPAADARARSLVVEASLRFPDDDWKALLQSNNTETEQNTDSLVTDQSAIAASYGHDTLTNNTTWQSISLNLLTRTTDKHYADVHLDSFERFGLDDWQIGASYTLPLHQTWSLYTDVSYSPTHRVIANRKLEARAGKMLSGDHNLQAGLSHARYSTTSSHQLILAWEHYWSSYRAAYTYRLIDVMNAGTGHNHNIQLSKTYAAGNTVGISVASGEDVEFDGTPNPPISTVKTVSIIGRHTLAPHWSLIYSITTHQQGDFYNRNGFVLGIRYDY